MESSIIFSIIIVGRQNKDVQQAVDKLECLDFSRDNYEVLLSLGDNPSLQRNMAVEKSRGKWIVFLDNDSLISSSLLKQYYSIIEVNKKCVAVGGPSLLSKGSTAFEQNIHVVFSSAFGVGPVRSRYSQNGEARVVTERELILCNLCVKRESFLLLDGFSIDLFPNEENCFLNRLRKYGECWYDPEAYVTRHHRTHWGEFIIQMIRYGIGRMKQFKMNPGFIDIRFFIPLLFSLYIFYLPFLLSKSVGMLIYLIYLLINLTTSIVLAYKMKRPYTFVNLIALFFLCHFFYGFGLIIGIFSKVHRKSKTPVEIIHHQ